MVTAGPQALAPVRNRTDVARAVTRAVPVLLVSSGLTARLAVRDRLQRAGAVVVTVTGLSDALRVLDLENVVLVVLDLAGSHECLAAVRVLRAQSPSTPIVGLMDAASPVDAGLLVDEGLIDVWPWPCDDADVARTVATAADRRAERIESRIIPGEGLIAHSASMRAVRDALAAATTRQRGTLIVGEPGTGRTLIARLIHEADDEFVTRPAVTIDCGTGSAADLDRRLFGEPERSAESDAGRVGRTSAFVAAQGGSLVLKRLPSAPSRVQARLARLLRDREAYSVDARELITLDVRVIAIVDPDVDRAVADGRLQRELFDRVADLRIDVPPFRSRPEDLPLLVAAFLREALRGRTPAVRCSRAALALLSALPWQGNAAEMRRVLRAVAAATAGPVIQLEDVLPHVALGQAPGDVPAGLTLRDARVRFEREYISRALIRHRGRAGEAAAALGVQRTNLYRKMRQLRVSTTLLSRRS